MKKLLLLILLLIVCCPPLHAQFQNGLWTGKQAYNWYFGAFAAINFETMPPQALNDSAMSTFEGSGTISDSDGNLLFYTDGTTVWNMNHEIMENGEGLNGAVYTVNGPSTPPSSFNTTTQNGLIIPVPGNPDLYYIFSQVAENIEGYPTGLYYSEVDLSLDGGLGAVTSVKNVQLSPYAGETLTAVHHLDGEQLWVITQTGNYFNGQNEFHAYLVSSGGINTSPVVSVAGAEAHGGIAVQMKASPDGSKLALTESIYSFIFDFPAQCQLFDFDISTGAVSNAIDLSSINASPSYNTGVEFSPNNRFLYVTGTPLSGFTTNLYQVDLQAGDSSAIIGSAVIINPDGTDGMMQLGPDGKIYLGSGDNPQLPYFSVIEYPNNKGIACGYATGLDNGLDLGQKLPNGSIPVFIQSFFESGILYEGGVCPGQAISFSTIRIPGITGIVWDFGDPASGEDNTSTNIMPVHSFSAGGTYTVTAVITSNGAEQTATTQVIVLPAPEAAVPIVENLTECADASGTASFDLQQLTAEILNGLDPDSYTVAFYSSENNLSEGNPIDDPDSFMTGGQAIYAKVMNEDTGCFSVVTFELIVNQLPFATDPADFELCGDAGEEMVFDLTQQDALILAGQATPFVVAYFATTGDIETGDAVNDPGNFASSGQTMYAVVYNYETGCTSAPVEFELIVREPLLIGEPLLLAGCSPFNLSEAMAGFPADKIIGYYQTREDALDATGAINDFDKYHTASGTGEVYVRVEDAGGCVEIYLITLEIGRCEIPRGISPNDDGMNDTFDLSDFEVEEIEVFNRYGLQVYAHGNNYTNQWHGQSESGSELPSGTYYYMIQLRTGETRTGWVYINREEQ